MRALQRLIGVTFITALALAAGCDRRNEAPPTTGSPQADSALAVAPQPSIDPEVAKFFGLDKKHSDDLDAMRERGVIRALVTYNHTQYFFDGFTQRGLSYEALKLFEEHLNRKFKTGKTKIHITIIPVTRDELIPRLIDGTGDIALGGLTITPEREAVVDFCPSGVIVRELLVTGPTDSTTLASAEDLSGREVWVRPSSSYRESLDALNERLVAAGKPPVKIRDADEVLEAEDLLEMVNAGLIGATVVDDYLAEFWAKIFPQIHVHDEFALREGGRLGWALRRENPQLKAVVGEFLTVNEAGTKTANILIQRYFEDTRWARNAYSHEDLDRFRQMIVLFQRYADRYQFDWLMCAAQGYQESQLNQKTRSRVGAVGVMQVMPATARSAEVGIPNIEQLEPNIHAGIKYMRVLADTYFPDLAADPKEQMLFSLAGYNAGPNRIARLRKEAAASGLDPDRWFRNVEIVTARRVGSETVRYVSNIYKYYVAYKVVAERLRNEGRPVGPAARSAPGG